MNCKTFNKRLIEYIENESNDELNKQMKDHIEKCTSCHKLYKERLELKGLFKDLFKAPNYTSQRCEIMNKLDNKFYNKSYSNKIFYHFNRNKYRYSAALACSVLLFFTLPIMKNSIDKNIKEIQAIKERGKILDRHGHELVGNLNNNAKHKDKTINGKINVFENRKYAKNNSLIDVLGVVNNEKSGITGIEKQYDNELKSGKDITLTVDSSIQNFVEKSAEKALKERKAKAVTIIVMNPKNGELLAMVNKTDNNINNILKNVKTSNGLEEVLGNKAINDSFEPGSIFKVITSSAAMAEGLIKENDKFVCTGRNKIYDRYVKCSSGKSHGKQSFEEIFKNSCNIGFAKLAQRLGATKLNKYIKSFGFGEKTGIDLPGEVSGNIKTENLSKVDVISIAIGQTNTVSPIQYLAAFNALANQGEWVRPHVMKQIEVKDLDNKKIMSRPYDDFNRRKVVDRKIAKKMCEILAKNVSEGSGNKAYIKGYDIGGKSGTIIKLNKKLRCYEKDKYIATFVGMALAKDAKVTVYVSIDEPSGMPYYGSIIAAPVAREIFQYLISAKID